MSHNRSLNVYKITKYHFSFQLFKSGKSILRSKDVQPESPDSKQWQTKLSVTNISISIKRKNELFHGFDNFQNGQILRNFIKIIHIKQSLYYSKYSNMGRFSG